TVFMTTGNRPTPVLRYPTLGSLIARLSSANPAAPPFVAFRHEQDARGFGSIAGFIGPAYDPFVLEVVMVRGSTVEAVVDTRGVVLPPGFTLDRLESRDGLARSFDRAFEAVDRNADLVDGLDAFHR